MSASDIAGTPFGNRIVTLMSSVPGDTSMTVPCMSIGVLTDCVVSGAETVVALGPLPTAYTRWS